MIAFRHILCPIDFSEPSIRALTYATTFASWCGAALEVLHVAPAFADGAMTPLSNAESPPVSVHTFSRKEIADEIQRAITATGPSSVNATPLVQEGHAHDVIRHRCRAVATTTGCRACTTNRTWRSLRRQPVRRAHHIAARDRRVTRRRAPRCR